MAICDIARQKVIMVSEDASIKEAAGCMRQENVGAVVVVRDREADKTPVGIVTDRDLATRLMADGVDSEQIKIKNAMTKSLLTVQEDQGVYDVIHLMAEKGVRRAPVVDSKNKVVGMVTADDLLQLLSEEFRLISGLICEQSKSVH